MSLMAELWSQPLALADAMQTLQEAGFPPMFIFLLTRLLGAYVKVPLTLWSPYRGEMTTRLILKCPSLVGH
jgi:hypothetical protein